MSKEKGFTNKWKAFAMTAVLLTSAAMPAKASKLKTSNDVITLKGIVVTSVPIRNARITIYKDNNIVATIPNATDKNGYFKIDIDKSLVPVGSKVLLKSFGGETGMMRFDGTLYSSLKASAGAQFVHMNVATTLSSIYQARVPGTSATDADNRVRKFLKLPASLPFNFQFENDQQTVFSARSFVNTAEANGGFNPFMGKLTQEITSSPNSVHAFPAIQSRLQNANLKIDPTAKWVVEKLLAAVGGQVGSEIFSALQVGVGIPSEETKIYASLNMVLGRLTDIQNTLSQIESEIVDDNYSTRAINLLKVYYEHALLMEEIKQLSLEAQSNTGADGFPINADVQADIIARSKVKRQAVLSQGKKFVTDTYAEFIGDGSVKTLGTIFAKSQYLKAKVIDKNYFDTTSALIEQYKSYQAAVLALYFDAQSVDSAQGARDDFNAAKDFLITDQIKYPDMTFFNTAEYVNATKNGTMIYDRMVNLLWDLKYQAFRSCGELLNNSKATGSWRTPGFDESVSLLDNTGNRGQAWSAVMKKLGFGTADVDATPMVTFGCNMYAVSGRIVTMVNWFGSETSGPWNQYYDDYSQFYRVAKDKKVDGPIYKTMKVKSL